MNDLVNMCLPGMFVILGLVILSRMMGGGTDFTRRGSEYSHYDDDNIDSHGSFGGSRGSSSRNTSGGRVDNPNIEGRGSFGRSKE